MKKQSEFKTQLMRIAREVQGAPSYVRPVKAKKVKDPRMFDADQFKGEPILFPCLDEMAIKVGKVAAIVLLCLSCFTASAQNTVIVLNPSTKYVAFTWERDTLDNSEFKAFFLALDYAEASANRMANELTNSLLMKPTAVDQISEDMGKALFGVSFTEYACFFHLREYRARVAGGK